MAASYNTVAIRELLGVYSDEDLKIMCYDYFYDVHEQFAEGMPRTMKVQRLIEYAVNHDAIPRLLEQARRQNPRRYEEFRGQLLIPDWSQSANRTGDVGTQPTRLISAPPRKQLRRTITQPTLSPPAEIRLNLNGIRRQVEVLNACTEFYSQAEDISKLIAPLQSNLGAQISICANASWQSARRGLEDLTVAYHDLRLRVRAFVDDLMVADLGLRQATIDRALELKRFQGEVDLINEQLRDQCDQMSELADVADGAIRLQDCRNQLKDRLRDLNRKVANVSDATIAVRLSLYGNIKECVKRLTALVPMELEAE